MRTYGPGQAATIPITPANLCLSPSSTPSPNFIPNPTTTFRLGAETNCKLHHTSVAICDTYNSCSGGGAPSNADSWIDGGGGGRGGIDVSCACSVSVDGGRRGCTLGSEACVFRQLDPG